MFITDIFESVHGEVNGHHQGRIVTFIRLSGCNLKCPYCDTKETWDPLNGENLNMPQVLKRVQALDNDYICITGGEPLMDSFIATVLLLTLWEHNYKISVETNGSYSIANYFRYVDSFVIDYKLNIPDYEFRMSNCRNLRPTDVIKFVVGNEREFFEAREIILDLQSPDFNSKAIIAISPILDTLSAKELMGLMLNHKIRKAVLSLQIHKIFDFK